MNWRELSVFYMFRESTNSLSKRREGKGERQDGRRVNNKLRRTQMDTADSKGPLQKRGDEGHCKWFQSKDKHWNKHSDSLKCQEKWKNKQQRRHANSIRKCSK